MSILSQFTSPSCQSPWQAAIQVLRYLATTLEYGLSFRGDIKFVVTQTPIGQMTRILDGPRSAIALC